MATRYLELPPLTWPEGFPAALPDFLPMCVSVDNADEWAPGDLVDLHVLEPELRGLYLLTRCAPDPTVPNKLYIELLRDTS